MTDEPLRATVTQKAALFGPRGDVLLLRDGEETWEFPGGRIGCDETVEEGLLREIREETGLDVEVGRPVYTCAWVNDRDRGRFAVVYRCSSEVRGVTLSDEHTDWTWADPETALEEHLSVRTQRAALRRALEVEG
ncbi:NUDIX hydrolase [Halegenticoccus tardaugens]|uniref:NUDIX hydrolase n=1 Tax=Halegenticoccus tardaugens TaxID=2071624 RepID=UPI00100BCBC4|nr:NUDIX domain-containing protein [Halegenticoccus tardaugens]